MIAIRDATIAQIIQEKTLKFIREFVAEHPLDGSCPFDKMNSDECLNKRDGQCGVCVIDHAIESLHSAKPISGDK
jgi:hypothetical protein